MNPNEDPIESPPIPAVDVLGSPVPRPMGLASFVMVDTLQ